MEVKIASPKKIRDARRPHLDLPPCMVCGGKASGIHYGVNTCQGCKVFFQRSLRRDVPFECKKSGKCKIIDSNRGNCPACRILKCHAVGMSREGIRMGRYTLTERTLKINEVKKLKAENSEITTPLSQNINIIDAEMTGTEYSLSESEVSPASSDNRHCMSTSSLSPNLPQRELISDSESVGDKSISPPESQQFSDSGYDDARKGSESTNSNSRKDKFCIITDVLRKEMALLQNSKSSHLEGPNENGSSPESQLASDQKEAPSTTRVGRDSCIVNHDRTSELPSNAGNGRQMSQKISKEVCDLDISNKKSHLSTCPEVVLLTKEEETFLYKITEAFRSMTIEPDLTDEDIKLRLKEAYTTYQYKTQLFGQMKALSMEEYKQVRKETGLDVDGRIALVNQWTAKEREYIENYVHFAHVIPGFSSLPFKDQVALIKSALYDFDLFTNCRGIDPDLEMIWMNTGQIYHLNEVCMFDTEEICKDYCEMCRKIQAMRLTFTELALLVCVCLTFRDRCRLISPNQVEEIQLDLVRLLRKVFLQTRRDAKKAGTCFVQIMNIFISCRDLSENVNKNWLKLSKDEFIQEIIPDIETYLNVE